MTIAAGQRIGPYELVAPLGAGGMGEVWRARDERFGRDVAVKFLAEGMVRDRDARKRFEREARAAGALSHPSILAVFDVGAVGERPYLVSELLRGVSLREKLANGPLEPSAVAVLGAQLAAALAVAHRAGVVHRDLKPENVFLTDDGRIKILDFGLATLTESEPGVSELHTRSDMIVGTIGYISPEQLRGERAGPSADLFALGCLLYEALTGASPFRSASVAATFQAVLAATPEPVARRRPETPPGLAQAVERCLEKEPESRPSASELESALAALGMSGPTMVFQAPVAAARRATRGRWLALGAALALLAIVVFGLLARHPERGALRRQGDEAAVATTAGTPGGSATAVPGAVGAGAGERGTSDEEAWKLFVRANHEWEKRGAALLDARDLYKQAVDRDPSFARAWLGLADTYAVLHDFVALSTEETFPKAKAAAERALALDPTLAGAHVDLAYVAFFFDRDWAVAEREFRSALALEPGAAKAHQWFSELLISQGRFDEALAELHEAQRLDPLAPMMFAEEVWHLTFAGRVPEAIERGERANLDFAAFGPLRAYRALALIVAGRAGEAVSLLDDPRMEGVSPIHHLWLAYAEAVTGATEKAAARLDEGRRRYGDAYLNSYYRSYPLIRLGREQEALDALATSIARREEQVVWMKFDPHLAPLRKSPRFAELLRQAGFGP